MALEFRRSTEFSLAELASVFTASYHGYFIPFALDKTQLRYMVEVFDLDLSRSLVAVERQRPVGLANLGRREERTWLGGVGVVPDRRGSGVGESLTRMLLDQAREAGAREMVLEVIVENAPAIALYEKLGFARTRELEVLSLGPRDRTFGKTRDRPRRSAEGRRGDSKRVRAVATRRRDGRHLVVAGRLHGPSRSTGLRRSSARTVTASACSRPRATPPALEHSLPHYARAAASRR